MLYYILKFTISAILIVAISEISKRYSLTAGILASLPIVSVLAMTWLYIDTGQYRKGFQALYQHLLDGFAFSFIIFSASTSAEKQSAFLSGIDHFSAGYGSSLFYDDFNPEKVGIAV